MDPIALDIRYGLPEKEYKKYLKFINQWWQLPERIYTDPLAVNTPPDKLELAYVERPEVEDQIYSRGCKIIVGSRGSGKTTLWQKKRRDPAGHDVLFLHISPDVLIPACLIRHQEFKYSKILIDGTEHLSQQSIVHLIETAQHWYTKTSGILDFIVFVNRERKGLVEALDCVRQGAFTIYELPPWRGTELQSMLGLRIAAWRPTAIDYNSFLQTPGIPADVSTQMYITLQRCRQFNSDDELRAVFVDQRIALWRNALPEASDSETRIGKTIAYLWNCENTQHENGLILFLYVLSDRVESGDIRKQQLIRLADALESVWLPVRTYTEKPSFADYTLNWAIDMPGLDDEAKREFISVTANGALAKSEQSDLDAPTHVLNLARGLIAACAGCWVKRYSPPLGVHHLQSIVDIYWGEGGKQ